MKDPLQQAADLSLADFERAEFLRGLNREALSHWERDFLSSFFHATSSLAWFTGPRRVVVDEIRKKYSGPDFPKK